MKFQYFINEPLGTVVCKGKNPIDDIFNEYCQFTRKYRVPFDCDYFSEFSKKYKYELDKLVGMAKHNYECSNNFDAEFGKKLALERYMKGFEFYREKFYDGIWIKYNEFVVTACVRAYGSHERRHYERTEKISNLIDSLKEKK